MFWTHGDKTTIRKILYLFLMCVKLHRGPHFIGGRAAFCSSLELMEVTFFFLRRFDRFRVMASPYMASRSHSLDTPHSVELLWTNDQPDEETATDNTQRSQEPYIHAPARLKPAFPASERPLGSGCSESAGSTCSLTDCLPASS
jgi:hypothetical protein